MCERAFRGVIAVGGGSEQPLRGLLPIGDGGPRRLGKAGVAARPGGTAGGLEPRSGPPSAGDRLPLRGRICGVSPEAGVGWILRRIRKPRLHCCARAGCGTPGRLGPRIRARMDSPDWPQSPGLVERRIRRSVFRGGCRAVRRRPGRRGGAPAVVCGGALGCRYPRSSRWRRIHPSSTIATARKCFTRKAGR